MMRVNGADLVLVPFEPVTVRAYVPFGAFHPTWILIVELAVSPGGALGDGGANSAATSAGNPAALSVTFWLNIPMDVTVTIAVLDSVVSMVRESGETEISKSGRAIVTFRVTRAHFTIGGVEGSRPVTFIM